MPHMSRRQREHTTEVDVLIYKSDDRSSNHPRHKQAAAPFVVSSRYARRSPGGTAVFSIHNKSATTTPSGTSVLPGEPERTARFDIGLDAAQDFRPRPRTASGKLAACLKSCVR